MTIQEIEKEFDEQFKDEIKGGDWYNYDFVKERLFPFYRQKIQEMLKGLEMKEIEYNHVGCGDGICECSGKDYNDAVKEFNEKLKNIIDKI
jgi:hypothetical protein